ncbi:hypothetical protein M0D21_06335 [Aquimarina sp. D1M17]|uniref:hypothetical protein n=1 Tax=Aquimarina acroporae TaxID=2937283 RepID=UPI0020BE8B09|nr:hypothetical protein [Aquimarina acroporae]MCK8521175.1 hypothetical protein [Aquimarina acroporae]
MPQQRKIYGGELYSKENIVAYTGDLHDNPTVYFVQYGEDGQKTYGHITQDHYYDKFNIGREDIKTNATYKLVNEWSEDEGLVSREYVNGKCFHESRSEHKLVGPNDEEVREILAKAIDHHPGIKKMNMGDYVSEQLDLIDEENDLEEQLGRLADLYDEVDQITAQMKEAYPKSAEDLEEVKDNLRERIEEQYDIIHEEFVEQQQNQKSRFNGMHQPMNASDKPQRSLHTKVSAKQDKNNSKNNQIKQRRMTL